ncbi:hypothetical protein [Streptomyces sp. NPDC006631]|uniref:hypothetical protein n=1 Tax=Streptomyces sp. NPDC006631 TaxID=3364752 RepID=UPI0036A51050
MSDLPPLGSFGVTATGGFIGWVIRKFTNSRVNHAFIVGPGGLIVEANPSGAAFGHITQYPNARFNLHTVLPDETRERIWDNAVALVGTPYGWLDILAITLKRFHISIAWVDRRIQRQDRLICSQLVDLDYQRSGVTLFDDGRLPQNVRPVDLDNILPD